MVVFHLRAADCEARSLAIGDAVAVSCTAIGQHRVATQRGRGFAPVATQIIKTRGSFPNDDAALKLLYLAIRNAGLRCVDASIFMYQNPNPSSQKSLTQTV
jgi:hypothetical protein